MNAVRTIIASAAALFALGTATLWSTGQAAAEPLIINNVAAPTFTGTGAGKRGVWANGGSVGGTNVDIVATIVTATLNHTLTTTNDKPSITSVGQDAITVQWRLFQAGTYNLATDSGGVPVVADVHVQVNDIDGPNNERVFVQVCSGAIEWIRIDRSATTGKAFGTVNGNPETFSLIGDRSYSNDPESGMEILYPDTSSFRFGRTANNGFFIRLDNPTYTDFDTLDYACGDFAGPDANDDSRQGVPGSPTVISILDNDTIATSNDNPPHNNTQTASEYGRQAVSLIAPGGATAIGSDADGDVIGFTVPGEGVWAFDDDSGELTFSPDPSFKGYATEIDYTFRNALGTVSNTATVSVFYPAIGVVKSAAFSDENGDGFAQAGETIVYDYAVTAYGADPLQSVAIAETGFTGAGAAPVPVLISGDTDADGRLQTTETWLYRASYTLVADDLAAGSVGNQATATGQTPLGTAVSDLSDSADPDDGDGSGTAGPGPDNGDATSTTFSAPPIDAVDDSPAAVDGASGNSSLGNALDNDTLGGDAATASTVAITVTAPASNPGVALDDTTGAISVAAGTPAATYTIGYQICEVLNPANCDAATITVTVDAAPIDAADDAPPAVTASTGNPSLIDAFANDTLDGAPFDPADIVATITTAAADAGVALDPATGTVSVAAGTPVGDYTIEYQICEVLNPANCDAATVSVSVVSPVIDAVDDAPTSVNGRTGDPAVGNALDNDTLDGDAATSSTVAIAVTSAAADPGVALDVATGAISVAAGTPAATYTIDYQICEALDPANCDDASITVTVDAAPIDALDDAPPTVTATTGNPALIDAFANDTLDGAAVDPADIAATVTTPASDPGVALDPATGAVSVAAGTPVGDYTIEYQICEVLNPTNCDDATVSVSVVAPVIDALDDAPSAVSGSAGNPALVNAFANDTLDGAPVDPADITGTITVPASDAGVALDVATGTVSVAAGTPAGDYMIGYRICETANPTNCDDAIVAVTVTAATVDAGDDAPPPVNGRTGNPALIDAFANDTLDGSPADTADIAATVATPAADSGIALDPATGAVSVAAGTPAGDYTIGYRICEVLNPANCDDATVAVTVTAGAIEAADDAPAPVNGRTGNPALIDAFANDTLDGAAVDLADIAVTVVTPAAEPGVALDTATGTVSVAANTPAGDYTIGYRICEVLNPTNCDDATITVTVEASTVEAADDAPVAVDGLAGNPSVVDILANDTLDGAPVDPAEVAITVVTPATDPGVALDVATGIVSVAANTPAGDYTIGYSICEVLNPANCNEGTISVTVSPPTIDAGDDTVAAPVDTANAIVDAVNLLDGDTLGGGAATPANVTIVPIGRLPAGFTLDADGTIDIAQGTASGDYVFGYRLCEIVNPTNCDIAAVSILVRKSVPAVAGSVYLDENGNGQFDGGEDGLSGYTVELRQGDTVLQTATSDADGAYRIFDFEPGSDYALVFIDPETGVAVGGIQDLTFASGTILEDRNQAIDPSGVIYSSATGAPIAGAVVELRTAGGAALPASCLLPGQQSQTTGSDGRYRFDVVPGGAAACPATETEYRIAIAAYPAGFTPAVSALVPPEDGALDATSCPIDAQPGGPCQVSADNDAPSAGASTPYYLAVLLEAGDPNVVNNHIPVDPVAAVPATGLTVTKIADRATAKRGEAVSYRIVARNSNLTAAGPLDVVDQLPEGFLYLPDSATVGGAAVNPSVSGRRITFGNLTVPAAGSLEIRLTARIGVEAEPGDRANTVRLQDSVTGTVLSATARAVVRVEVEHVFDCGEIIGKVFDDRDRDGAQDEGEEGLPGVRVATVRGILITTDRHGRFSVPCAELPAKDIGSNFILKLDTRTLPTGYRVTTENPRVVRLTAGKATKLNFGAAASRMVRIELSARAFPKGKPGRELLSGIDSVVARLGREPSGLSLTYRADTEPPGVAEARLAAVEKLLTSAWRRDGGGQELVIETRVSRGE